jgi:hypothetical protein
MLVGFEILTAVTMKHMVFYVVVLTLQRDVLSPFSRMKNKPGKKTAEAGSKLNCKALQLRRP